MSLGLPSFSMIFSGKAVSAIERSARGIVAMILTDGTEGGKDLNIYKKVDEVDFQNWTEQNYNNGKANRRDAKIFEDDVNGGKMRLGMENGHLYYEEL